MVPLGNAVCFSFTRQKFRGIGDGGMIVTNDELVAERIKMLGFMDKGKKYYSEILGFINSGLMKFRRQFLESSSNI